MLIRIITALILVPIVIGLTYWLPSAWFACLWAIVMGMGWWEWSRLIRCPLTGFLLIIGGLGIAMMLVYPRPGLLYAITLIGALYWLVQGVGLRSSTVEIDHDGDRYGLHGAGVLFVAWVSLVLLHQTSPNGAITVIGLFVTVWAADVFAYFVGKAIGKRKLAPTLSPGKTVEGVIGGLSGAIVLSVMFAVVVLSLSGRAVVWWGLVAVLTVLVSVVGDLYESRLKRKVGVKDSGKLLPGHGGLLDRIDALIAAAPVFVALWWPMT